MKAMLAGWFLCFLSSLPVTAQTLPTTERAKVLAVVQAMFDGMRAKDSIALSNVFDSNARLVGIRTRASDGQEVVQNLTAREFIAFILRDARAQWTERAFDPEVRIDGSLATVWAAYDFHFGQQFSHCGTDAVQLLEVRGSWKIQSIADTYQTAGCPTRPSVQATPAAPVFQGSGAFLALSVPDLDEAIRWYRDKLGLRLTMRVPPDQGRAVAIMEGNNLIVELLHVEAARPLRQIAPQIDHTTLVHGQFKAGVIVEDFDATMAMLRERAVEIAIGPFPARNGQRANAIIRDPAGNLIQFFGR